MAVMKVAMMMQDKVCIQSNCLEDIKRIFKPLEVSVHSLVLFLCHMSSQVRITFHIFPKFRIFPCIND